MWEKREIFYSFWSLFPIGLILPFLYFWNLFSGWSIGCSDLRERIESGIWEPRANERCCSLEPVACRSKPRMNRKFGIKTYTEQVERKGAGARRGERDKDGLSPSVCKEARLFDGTSAVVNRLSSSRHPYTWSFRGRGSVGAYMCERGKSYRLHVHSLRLSFFSSRGRNAVARIANSVVCTLAADWASTASYCETSLTNTRISRLSERSSEGGKECHRAHIRTKFGRNGA